MKKVLLLFAVFLFMLVMSGHKAEAYYYSSYGGYSGYYSGINYAQPYSYHFVNTAYQPVYIPSRNQQFTYTRPYMPPRTYYGYNSYNYNNNYNNNYSYSNQYSYFNNNW